MMVKTSSSSSGRAGTPRGTPPRDATRRGPTTVRCARAKETFERRANGNDARGDDDARGRVRRVAAARRRRRRRARAARDQGLGVGLSHLYICNARAFRDRCLARTRTRCARVMNACMYILRPHVQRHQFRERLRLAKSREFGGVRLLRLANGKRGPHSGGDLRVDTNERTRRLVSLSRSLYLPSASRDARMNGVFSSISPSSPFRPFSRSRPNPTNVARPSPPPSSPSSSPVAPRTHHPHPPNPPVARTKHIKNTLGPYSQSLSPGGAFTLYTTPSRMNMRRAQENMNHTVTCRPRNVLFSSSSFVTIVAFARGRLRIP